MTKPLAKPSVQRRRNTLRWLACGLAALLLAACNQHAGAPPSANTPTNASSASTIPPGVQAVQPDELTHYWVMANTTLTVQVPNRGANLETPTCSAVTYMIGSTGQTSKIRVRNTIPAGDLDMVAESAVKDLSYRPGAANATREPVFTYIIIPFNLPADPAARKRITDACIIKGFPQGYR